jgi:hypothetical protein
VALNAIGYVIGAGVAHVMIGTAWVTLRLVAEAVELASYAPEPG